MITWTRGWLYKLTDVYLCQVDVQLAVLYFGVASDTLRVYNYRHSGYLSEDFREINNPVDK